MDEKRKKFVSKIPELDLSNGTEMITEFASESHKHLLNAKNSLLVLDTVPDDREAVETIFKSFHTIKGLADFLNLEDLFSLTEVSETLLDMVRKNALKFEGEIVKVTKDSIESLYTLLELLSEQIENNGELKSEYFDVSNLVESIYSIIADSRDKTQTDISIQDEEPSVEIPAISIDDSSQMHLDLKAQLQSSDKELTISKKDLEILIADLDQTRDKLKEAQGRALENQRELVHERELAIKLTQQAQSMARVKSEFLASMAHEIRTLINAILGFANIMKNGPLNAKQREQLDTIILSGNLLLGIVNDILDFSKVEAGKLKLEIIDFNLGTLVEDVFRILRTKLNNKPINLYFKINDNVVRNLSGDPTRIKQILINLVDNAIKFTEDGEIGLRISLEESKNFPSKEHTLKFVVEDTGIGIPEDRKNAIFESFTQANTSVSRKYGGSGLGLTLCKNYIENMGGKIWIESEVGKGSKFIFTVTFPEGNPVNSSSSAENLMNGLAERKILVVESNERIRSSMKTLCGKLKIENCVIVKDSAEAMKILAEGNTKKEMLPDIIFIDILVPGKVGQMLAVKIRQDEKYANIKLIALSSSMDASSVGEILQQGFDEYLAKPIIESEFRQVLLEVLVNESGGKRSLTRDMVRKISCEGVKVLVAEDSLPNQELLKAHFESLGCIVDYVDNGHEAVEKAKDGEYDICLMDLQMPVMGGIEATKIIRGQLKRDFPIVALTAAEMEEEKEVCIKAGMNDYLPKPFDLLDLKEKIIICTKM